MIRPSLVGKSGWTIGLMLGCALASTAAGVAEAGSQDRGRSGDAVGRQTTSDGVWLEAIEIYTLPWDPAWRKAAEDIRFPSHFRGSAEDSAKRRKALEARLQRERVREKIDGGEAATRLQEFDRKEAELADRIRKTADRPMPLTIIRLWDGINRREHVLSFGKGQRAIVERFKQGKPLLAVTGNALPGDDFQAARATCGDIGPSSRVPTEFARLSDAPASLTDVAFGEIDASVLKSPAKIDVSKDPTPGSGVLSLALSQPPAELEIDFSYPWFAEFRVFELAKDGSRSREVRFEGEDSIVAIARSGSRSTPGGPGTGTVDPGSRYFEAIGRVEVQSPQPWGYEAEVVKWFGVAPKARLVSPRAGSNGRTPSGVSGKNAPGNSQPASTDEAPSSTPGKATDTTTEEPTEGTTDSTPPPLPEEPATPGIPDVSSTPTQGQGAAR